MTLKDEAQNAGKRVILVGISTAAMALTRWILSRPLKRAIARRRAKKAAEEGGRESEEHTL